MDSLDGLLADEGTEYWEYCFGLPDHPAALDQKLDVSRSAYAHIMGRVTYEAMAGALPTADHPFTDIMNRAQGRLLPDLKSGGRIHRRRHGPTWRGVASVVAPGTAIGCAHVPRPGRAVGEPVAQVDGALRTG